MGAKVLASSVAVLDEADRQQRIIDWMLFAQEQDYRLNYSEDVLVTTWRPGEPMHPHPRRFFLTRYGAMRTGGGNYVRQMIEEIDDNVFHVPDVLTYHLLECYDCEVWWSEVEGLDCWVCGVKSKDADYRRAYTPYSSDHRDSDIFDDYSAQMLAYSTADVEFTRLAFSRLSEGARRAGEIMSSTMADAMHRVQQQAGEMLETIWRRHHEEMDRQILFGGDRNAEPEMVVINGIRMPKDVPTTPEIPLPDIERVSIRCLEERRYVNSEPIWSRRGRVRG